jgi:hypothetical protein
VYQAGGNIYLNAPPRRTETPDSFLSRVAEATRARFHGSARISEHALGGCDYLRITVPADAATVMVRPVGVIDGPVTEDSLAAFVKHVHTPFAAADPQVQSELVYAGLVRFEPGELDPYVPHIKRLPPDAPILPRP